VYNNWDEITAWGVPNLIRRFKLLATLSPLPAEPKPPSKGPKHQHYKTKHVSQFERGVFGLGYELSP